MRVVLLPGLDGTGDLFRPLVDTAPAGMRPEVVALPPEPRSYAELVETLEPALRLDAGTLVVAESFSGPLAVHLAARAAPAGLVLCNSFVRAPAPGWLRLAVVPLLFRAGVPAFAARRWLVGEDAPADLVRAVQAAVRSVPPAVLASRVRGVLRVDATAALERCRAPLLYLRGTRDRLVSGRGLEPFLRRADASVARIPGPHLLLQRHPEACWRAITRFVDERCRG